jgi:hypothetical protein
MYIAGNYTAATNKTGESKIKYVFLQEHFYEM